MHLTQYNTPQLPMHMITLTDLLQCFVLMRISLSTLQSRHSISINTSYPKLCVLHNTTLTKRRCTALKTCSARCHWQCVRQLTENLFALLVTKTENHPSEPLRSWPKQHLVGRTSSSFSPLMLEVGVEQLFTATTVWREWGRALLGCLPVIGCI